MDPTSTVRYSYVASNVPVVVTIYTSQSNPLLLGFYCLARGATCVDAFSCAQYASEIICAILMSMPMVYTLHCSCTQAVKIQ